jgi:hypothetical protein
LRPSFLRRHLVLAWVGGIVLVLLVAAAIGISMLLRNAEPILRAQIVSSLQQRFHARVELDKFNMSLTGGLRAEGQGLRIWPPAETQGANVPASASPSGNDRPLISLDDFKFRAPLHFRPGEPIRISLVELHGLVVDMPQASHFMHEGDHKPAASDQAYQAKKTLLEFKIDTIKCTGTVLRLETSKPGKLPLIFTISNLNLTNIQPWGAMTYTADLVNAIPTGIVHTTGKFGPWRVEDPGESAIQGEYTFDNANLGDFKDIAGTMHSAGEYTGTLRNLAVDGEADVPNFALTHIGTAMPLQTQFKAMVDGTNGDTQLNQVNAVLGHSHFTVQGQVARVPVSAAELAKAQSPDSDPRKDPPTKGHDISLNVNVPQGRMEDFMKLVSKSGTPLLTGVLNLKTSLDIPPAKEPVYSRIKLKGTFLVKDAEFTSSNIQDRVNELSLRGQGLTKEARAKDKSSETPAESTLQSSFTVAGGVVTLPDLVYEVPGASIALNGTYAIDGGAINFAGKAKMQATISKMLGGWKGALASPLDLLFKKDGAGTEVPIRVEGTREDPHFGLDFGAIKHTVPQKPGDNGPVNMPPSAQK